MKFFVYYNDDYQENGGIGLSCHEDKASALEFIEGRIKEKPSRTLDDYVLIEGSMLTLKVVEYVKRIEA